MGYFAPNFCSLPGPLYVHEHNLLSVFRYPSWKNSISGNHPTFKCQKSQPCRLLVFSCVNVREDGGNPIRQTENQKYKWVRTGPNLSEEQKQAISQLPLKMTNRCKALMKQIICYSTENGSVSLMLAAWVNSTKPRRADWLSVIKELDELNHALYFEVFEHALTEESFEANIRDYTKIIHRYAKQNMLREAENALIAMKNQGFFCDQVTLTALVHMYSKAGNLKLAENSFEEMKLLGVPLDRRSYGSMIMAYVRARMLSHAESLLGEMEAQEISAAKEVYKALLRAFSMVGDSRGAQRIFDAIQLAGIVPDVKVCGLLINAYVTSGQSHEAHIAFENMRRSGLEPNDKCMALVLAAYEKENRLKEALDLLTELERNGVVLGVETSDLLVKWFKKIGVVEEVDFVLKDFLRMPQQVP